MNKRLLELADQAGFMVEGDKVFGESFDSIDNLLQKFAQLIVEECCDICYDNEYMSPNQCAWRIEAHFED